MSEGLLEALTFTGAEPVPRHAEALQPKQLGHRCSLLVASPLTIRRRSTVELIGELPSRFQALR